MLSRMALFAIAVICIAISTVSNAYSDDFYTAAVFEHARRGNWSTDTPEDIIQTNLAFYKNAASTAKSKGADIIVFPEYGIFPFAERQILKKILELVPDPKALRTNPCEESEEYSDRPILQTLSCIARDNSIVVVANTGDIQRCINETDCPDDGDFHFNANVAFDSDGTFIGRYYKEHLFKENGMDIPKEQSDPMFKTKFGTFAMFVCFDVVFKRITQIPKNDLEAILLPCMWLDPSPRAISIQAWQSFAIENNVTLIAANIQLPGKSAVGSGIFNAKNGALAYTYNPDGLSKLVVAKVPRCHSTQLADASESSITIITQNGTEEYENDGNKVPTTCSKKILGKTTDIYTDYRCVGENTSNYTFMKLDEPKGHLEACNNGMCCSLDYEATDMQENYYLGVYNGFYNSFNRYFWCEEKCLLLRCDSFENKTCAIFPLRSNTKFQKVNLSANISSEFLYPKALASGVRLVPVSDWKYGVQEDKAFINFENSPGKELLVLGFNGRCYERDPPYQA